ncbi:MAG TPA: ATP-binding protein [Candidatus Limnocylindrales bacterium]
MTLDEQDREVLRRIPLFAELTEEDLSWVADGGEPVVLAGGDVLAGEGEAGDALFVVVSGELEVVKRSRTTDVPIAVLGPGEIVGEMAIFEAQPRMASVRALAPTRVVRIRRDVIVELLRTRPSATLSMLRTVMGRLRSTEAMLREREKLAALGTLSAGLAHELNNPAAAVQRSASLLHDGLDRWAAATRALGSVVDDGERAALVAELGAEAARHAGASAQLDPLDASDRAWDLETFLTERGVPDAGELSSGLVAGGWDRADLERIEAEFPPDALGRIVTWLAAGSAVHALVDEVATGARRISEIVKAVKEYSYMDQAPVQRVDVRTGLDNTLVILRPKLKSGISIVREYQPDLPEIEAFGSELNQVWTNILDNAIDAMGGTGEIRIRALARDADVVVEICDDGPGMPAEVRERIFEPFYTTKPPGSGTGLGLHISHNVVARHGGRINIRSRPGETCFEVVLPRERRTD